MQEPGKNTDLIAFDDVKKIWYQIARNTTNDNFNFELQVHKYLLNIFHVGDYYYYIFNCGTASMEYISDSIKNVLHLNNCFEFTIEYLMENIHPEDLPYFLDFERKVTRFFNDLPPDKVLKYKVTYDYRLRTRAGEYKRVLQNTVTIQSDETGAVIRVVGVHTDITHLKKENGSTLSFIGLDGEPSYQDYARSADILPVTKSIFTKRETELLKLLAAGKTSAAIASILFISKETVDRHRKNMLTKTGSGNTAELLMYATKEGLI